MTRPREPRARRVRGPGRDASRCDARRASSACSELFPVLAERSGQPAETLSGGEQQMLAVGARAHERPRLLLLDEPSLGLAPAVIAEIFAALDALRAQGVTILLVEQDARLALKHADRGYVMRTGHVVLEGTAADLLAERRRATDLPRFLAWGGRMSPIWNPEYECMDRESLHELQLRRLQMTVAWVYERVPYYRAQLEERGVQAPRHQDARRRAAGSRSPTRPRCATRTRSGCSRCRSTRSCACTPRRARPASRSSSATRAATSTPGPSCTARVAVRGGRAPRRPGADGVPVRHVHRRLGHALRHRAHRRDRHSRQDPATPSGTS